MLTTPPRKPGKTHNHFQTRATRNLLRPPNYARIVPPIVRLYTHTNTHKYVPWWPPISGSSRARALVVHLILMVSSHLVAPRHFNTD